MDPESSTPPITCVSKLQKFTQLITREKTNQFNDSEEDELAFESNPTSPQPQPDLLIGLSQDSGDSLGVERRLFVGVCVASLHPKKMTKEQEKKTCRKCSKEVFLVELIKAEKENWHKNCFRCGQCQRQLGVDTYSSHDGVLYCKPHFKQLFQPKPITTSPTAERKKPELIIRENEPAPLPPDVVRASDPTTDELDGLEVDVKSKFEMFERSTSVADDGGLVKVNVKRSPSVLAKLAKYEGTTPTTGIPNEELYTEDVIESDEEDEIKSEIKRKLKTPTQALQEIMQLKQLEEVRAKWEDGVVGRSEELVEQRRNELAKFRTRLCQGKSTNLKGFYENIPTDSKTESKPIDTDTDTKKLKELFESEKQCGEKSAMDFSELESVAKQSRSLFMEMEQKKDTPPELLPRLTRLTSEDEEVNSKKKFFENYEESVAKKVFTPDTVEEVDAQEPYRDPEVVVCTNKKEQVEVGHTASKMLMMFKEMEKSDSSEVRVQRGLKQFTPPREPARVYESDEEEEQPEQFEDDGQDPSLDEKDAFLKEVGSLARARSLRARFERWEEEENLKNEKENEQHEIDSIESATVLKKRFEQMQLNKVNEKKVKVVRRFVEVDNMSDQCGFCEKKVYVMEKVEANNQAYHKTCFRCSVCKSICRMDAFTFHHGQLYCKNHFKQLFKIKGNYDEGFGHETQKQIFARKQAEKNN